MGRRAGEALGSGALDDGSRRRSEARDAGESADRGSLEFAALGSFLVTDADRAVALGNPKQQVVLALLLVNANRPITTERIVDELWGDRPPPSAVGTVQAYVSNLRRALEPNRPARGTPTILLSRNHGYELAVPPERIDMARFETLSRRGAELAEADPQSARDELGTALGLWRGPALVEFGNYEFAAIETRRLDELRVSALEGLLAAELRCGRSSQIVPELERAVADHPLRERLWKTLMLAYYRAGRQADALRAYRRHEAVLADELGLLPSPEIRQLEQAVLEQDPSLDPPVAAMGGSRPEVSGRLVCGRNAELRLFDESLTRAESGRGSLLLLRGEAGIGKTRLLEEMYERAAGRARVALARCVEIGGTPPFWPWIQVVRALGPDAVERSSGPYAACLTPLYPERAPTTYLDGRASPANFRVSEGLVHVLDAFGSELPTVLLIDDLHSADPDSLSVLTLLVSAIQRLPVVVVGTHRERSTSTPALSEALVELTRLEWVSRRALAPLTATEVSQVVSALMGGDVADTTIEAIHDRAEGNAFFTVELVRLLSSDHVDFGTDSATALPETVREIVDRRLDALTGPAQRLLRVAAVAGRSFDLSTVARAADLDLEDAVELAEAATAVGLIDETGQTGSYRFAHILMVDAIVSGLGSLRKAQLHRQLAVALESSAPDDPAYWDQLAHHQVEAIPICGSHAAIDALTKAGQRATAVNALELAERLFDQRSSIVSSLPASPERDFAELESVLDLALVWTLRHGYQSERLRAAFERIFDLTDATSVIAMLDPSTDTGTKHGVLAALQARCSFEIVAGEIERSTTSAQALHVLAARTSHPYVAAVANINAMVPAIHAGRLDEARRRADATDDILDGLDPEADGSLLLPLGQQSLVVTHLDFSAWLHWMRGDIGEARDRLQRARQVADRSKHAFSRAFHATIECLVGALEDSPLAVRETLDWGRSGSQPESFGFLAHFADVYEAWADEKMDASADGPARLRVAIESLHETGALVVATLHWAMLADLELSAGRTDDALVAVRTGLDRAEISGERFWVPELHRLEARALERQGAHDRARAALEVAERIARDIAVPPLLERIEADRSVWPDTQRLQALS